MVVYRNDSVFNKAAVKVWDLVEKVETHQIKELVDTLTRKKTQKLQLDCSDCKLDSEFCNCTFLGIMSENTLNIDFLLERNGLSWRWCPPKTVISNIFQCNQNKNISSKMICDGFCDCPDGLDESLGLCSPEETFYIAPVIALFVNSFAIAICCALKCSRKKDTDETKGEQVLNPTITRFLCELKHFLENPTSLKENKLRRRMRRMGIHVKVELLKTTYNIDLNGEEGTGQAMKTVVKIMFSTNRETQRQILTLVKNSTMPTAFKTRVIDLIKMGCMTKIKNYIDEVIPATKKVYVETAFEIFKVLIQIGLLPLQDLKDLAAIATMINFHYNVIQERSKLIDNISLFSVIYLLLTIYVAVQLLKMLVASSTKLPFKSPRCFPLGFICNPKWIPFFTESSLAIYKIENILQMFQLKKSIMKILKDINAKEEGTSYLWKDVQIKSGQVNQLYLKIEKVDFEAKTAKVPAIIGDILQGAVLLVLVLRTDLRIRGILGLSNLAGHLNVDNRESGVPDSYLLVLLLTWNLISPSFRVRDVIAGHKSSLLSPGGIALTLSLSFSLSMYFGITCFLGHAYIFIVPFPLILIALIILLAKSTVDQDFQKQPFSQRITYSLLAAIFPISSKRPMKTEEGEEEGENTGRIVAELKDSSSELVLLHILHFLNMSTWAAVYAVLLETIPEFSEAMGKIEQANGINSSWAIFLGCPVACLLSILARVAYNRVEPWRMINGSLKEDSCSLSCFPLTLSCSCCPPTLRSSFYAVNVEETQDPKTPAAEVIEMLDYIADNHR